MNAVMKPPRRRMVQTVSVDVDVHIDDVLDELSDEDLAELIGTRLGSSVPGGALAVYEHFALHGGAPQVLRDYLYEVTGRTLP